MKRTKHSAIIALCLLLTSSAFGQKSPINGGANTTAKIFGTIADRAGKPITSVEIVIKDATDKIVSRALTNELGRYCMTDLRPGRYTITRNAGSAAAPGDTVVADLPAEGLTINWRVAGDSALATAVDPGAAAIDCPRFLAGAGISIGNLSAIGAVAAAVLGPATGIPLSNKAIKGSKGKVVSPSM